MRAVKTLRPLLTNYLYGDAARYFSSVALRRKGEKDLENRHFGEAVSACRDSLEVTEQLEHISDSPFVPRLSKEKVLTRICLSQGLVGGKKWAELLPEALALLRSDTAIPDNVREKLREGLVRALEEKKADDLALLFRKWSAQEFPQNRAFQPPPSAGSEAENSVKPIKPGLDLPSPPNRPQPEQALYEKASAQQRSKKVRDALESYAQLFEEYPGSSQAQKASARVIDLAQTLPEPPDLNLYMPLLKRLPSKVIYDMAKAVWKDDAATLAGELYRYLFEHDPEDPQAGSACFFLGRMEEDKGRWLNARVWFEKVVRMYPTNPFFDRAHFKMGWLAYLAGEDRLAMDWLGYERALNQNNRGEAQALYWIWRVLERGKKATESAKYRDAVGKAAPVSYYAFLADRLPKITETGIGNENGKMPTDFSSTLALQRAQGFLSVGLWEPAISLLGRIDVTDQPQLAVNVASLLVAAKAFLPAINIANQVVSSLPSSELPKDLATLLFPSDHEDSIRAEAAEAGIDPLLLFSLIKQESGYSEAAESRVGALGLMQIMPATANQVASDHQQPLPNRDDLLSGGTNVRIGARYLASLLKKFDGNLVYALASYNAGPVKVSQWVKRWKKLDPIEFIELIPFEETRNYVKSILRNYAFYAELKEKRKVDPSSFALVSLR